MKTTELFSLDRRVALVTGGAGTGYGRQAVEALAEAGAHVIIAARNQERSRERANELNAAGLKASACFLELQDEASIEACAAEIEREHGVLDVLVNNASANCLKPLEEISTEEWNRVLHVNLTGPMLLSRSLHPLLLKGEGRSIINLSSIYGVVAPDQRIYGESGLNSPLVYGVSKAGIVQMTRYLATYWAPDIRVNCISPGGLYNQQAPDFVGQYEYRTPLGRMGGGDDLKGAILYLASKASEWVTGHNLMVDGGWTAW